MSNFKSPTGHWLTKALFFELCSPDKREQYCQYTLKDEDHEGYPSLKRLYMSCSDPTEYEFATTYLGGWEHWKRIYMSEWFVDFAAAWREEFEIRLRSEAIRDVAAHAKGDKGFQAAKWLAEGSYKPKEAGRKSNKAKETQARIDASIAEDVQEDLRRLKLIK